MNSKAAFLAALEDRDLMAIKEKFIDSLADNVVQVASVAMDCVSTVPVCLCSRYVYHMQCS